MTIEEQFCTLIVAPERHESDLNELRKILESGSEGERVEAMKSALSLLSNGVTAAGTALLMTIIRFVFPNQKNKLLKKLVLLFFELVPKVDEEGKLLSEMILLCNALRNDLQHPNEYVRGVTLRFLTRIREVEILEPLVPSVRQCLEHRHPYVRRNAIMAVYSIAQSNNFLLSDATELLAKVLSNESEASCQRNAFVSLTHLCPEAAGEYFHSLSEERLVGLDANLQLALIEYVNIEVTLNSHEINDSSISRTVTLLQSASNVVKFAAASALNQLSESPSIIRAIASCYIDLIVKETDNNSKLLVLTQFKNLQSQHSAVVGEMIMEMVRVLGASDLSVRQKALDILAEGINSRQSKEFVDIIAKEIIKATEYESCEEYRKACLAVLNQCTLRFPSLVGPEVLSIFISVVGREDDAGYRNLPIDCVKYLKSLLERIPSLRNEAIPHLLNCILHCSLDSPTMAGLLWIIGEFTVLDDIKNVFSQLFTSLGPLPIVESEREAKLSGHETGKGEVSKSPLQSTTRKLNADGTYATESALTSKVEKQSHLQGIRAHILNSQYSVATSLAACISKLALKAEGEATPQGNSLKAQAMLAITSITRATLTTDLVQHKIDKDSYDRMLLFLRVLAKTSPILLKAFTVECEAAFEAHLKQVMEKLDSSEGSKALQSDIDSQLTFRFSSNSSSTTVASRQKVAVQPDTWESDLRRALGKASSEDGTSLLSSLSHVVQLTGLSDEIYAETYVTISHSDIILDILLVNQTARCLQNVSIDLSVSGDLKVNEKPQSITLAPNGFSITKAAIKVKSTSNGQIFGCISYGMTEVCSIFLSDISIDITEFIKSQNINENAFRTLWPTLEWENKINVPSIEKMPLSSIVKSIVDGSHLACLTPNYGISQTGEYLAANMHAQSIFGEVILANICLDNSNGLVSGHIRLRSKTQGIAVALGDRLTEIVTKLATLH